MALNQVGCEGPQLIAVARAGFEATGDHSAEIICAFNQRETEMPSIAT